MRYDKFISRKLSKHHTLSSQDKHTGKANFLSVLDINNESRTKVSSLPLLSKSAVSTASLTTDKGLGLKTYNVFNLQCVVGLNYRGMKNSLGVH